MIPVVSFVGRSNSGKTTFLQKVITLLKAKGFKIAVVKNTTHEVDFDVPGKDTWKFSRAGADSVILNGPAIFIIQEKVTVRKQTDEVLAQIQNVDLILWEGAKDAIVPKVWFKGEGAGENSGEDSGENDIPENIIAAVHPVANNVKSTDLPSTDLPVFGRNQEKEFVEFLLCKLKVS